MTTKITHRFILRSPEIRQRASNCVATLPVSDRPLEVIVRPHKEKRSLEQSAYYWQLITEIANFVGEENKRVSLQMKARFLAPDDIVPMPDGSQYAVYPSTAYMSVKELAEFSEKIEAFAALELGFIRRHR